MAHQISINSVGQSEAVFGYNEKPWWSSATMPATVLDGAVSFDDIFTIAFPWQAEMEQLQYSDGSLSSQHGIRRSDTKAELGVHSGKYGAIQPRDLFEFCSAFFQAYPEVPIASAIAMQGGAVLNISARIGEIDILNSGDKHLSYLCFVNSFNGTLKAQVYKSYVRPVCMNTTISGISSADFSMAYKHTKNVRERIKKDTNNAAQLMLAQQATDTRVKEILETLAQRKLTKQTYENIMVDLFGDSDSTRTKNIKRDVSMLFATNDNNAFPEWKGTGYALYNAVTNYVDHEKTVRVTSGRSDMSENQIRFESSIIGQGAELKMKAMERILVLSDGSEALEDSPTYFLPSHEDTPKRDNARRTSQNASQPIIEVIPTQVPSHTSDSIVDHSESSNEVWQDVTPEGYGPSEVSDYDDSSFVMVDLYTTAPSKYDGPNTKEIAIVEKLETTTLRHVQVQETFLFEQIDIYKGSDYYVNTKEKHEKLVSGQ